MKTALTVLFVLLSSKVFCGQTSLEELQSLNTMAKFQYVKPETLDKIMAGLRLYESNPVQGQDSLILDTYNAGINGYMVNNHFKQAYETFNRYLEYKEKMLSKQKADAISKAFESVKQRQSSDDQSQGQLQSDLTTLNSDNDRLETKRQSFKRNFSFALILLSAVFAVVLVMGGIKLMNLRSELMTAQKRMKDIHKTAVVGTLSKGIAKSLSDNLEDILKKENVLMQQLKKQESFPATKKSLSILKEIDQHIKNAVAKLKNA